MKSSASESKAFQSRSKGEIPGRARRKERLSRSKLKQAFLIDSDAELFMYLLIQCIGSAHEKFGVWTGLKKIDVFSRNIDYPDPLSPWVEMVTFLLSPGYTEKATTNSSLLKWNSFLYIWKEKKQEKKNKKKKEISYSA